MCNLCASTVSVTITLTCNTNVYSLCIQHSPCQRLCSVTDIYQLLDDNEIDYDCNDNEYVQIFGNYVNIINTSIAYATIILSINYYLSDQH